jgi:hypothetical protein
LYHAIAARYGTVAPLDAIDRLPAAATDLVVVVPGDPATIATALAQAAALQPVTPLAVCYVVSDGYLGTDTADLAAAQAAAAFVATARSQAARRQSLLRANVVAVPAGLLGEAGEGRGPLGVTVDAAAIADVIGFLLSSEAGYVSGQVVFADGGRQLFSSMTG